MEWEREGEGEGGVKQRGKEIINIKIISKNKPMSSFSSFSISVKLANFNILRNNLHLI